MPGADGRQLRVALVLAAVAAAVYLNTLPAQFTFDDSFAVLYNGDVTDSSKPLRELFRNDFWGQKLRSPMSHKSYRPLTILSFRAQHAIGRAVMGDPHAGQGQAAQDDRRRKDSRGAQPLPFHICNVMAHAAATAVVYRLARQLAAARRLPTAGTAAGAAAASPGGSIGGGAVVGGSGSGSRSAAGTSWAAELEPIIAALLFAVHPVHTEAVAGIVGHAEMLCALLSMAALLCYMAAADGRVESMAAHWRRVAAALALGLAAALAKEIGITIMGAMMCYDILVAPLAFTVQPPAERPGSSQLQLKARHSQRPAAAGATVAADSKGQRGTATSPTAAGRGAGRAASPAAVAAAASELIQHAAAAGSSSRAGAAAGAGSHNSDVAARKRGLRLKLLRMAAAVVAVAIYIKARSWLAGDQLVRIYRKVENPIAFAESSLVRKLTTGYLHARYAGLLVAPVQLSADWSYSCIEYVSSLSDPRNLATAVLYSVLLYIGLAARPWEALLEWAGRRKPGAVSQAQHERRWRLAVAAGLLVGPFFPASNVLFYVGTFIGERLLYFPSVGYCILLAQPLAAALQPLLHDELGTNMSSSPGGASKATDSSGRGGTSGRWRRARAVAAAALLALLLCCFCVKTVVRNMDWLDEERLFRAAQKVCWASGKVQLNSGIIERRHNNMEKAEMHFRLAKAADPKGFCEPDYHIGLTLLNKSPTQAVVHLERGVACKYTAADSVNALNKIFMSLLESGPQAAPGILERWANVLARPEVQRYTEAVTYYESAAAKADSTLQGIMVYNRADAVLAAAPAVPVGRTPDYPVRVAATKGMLEQLQACMLARRPVVLAVLEAGGHLQAPRVKQAAYRYLAEHGEECRGPRPVLDGVSDEDRAARSATFHTQLMHKLQEADVNDPWYQREWGQMLVAGGRTQEALAHLEVAGHIFAAQIEQPAGPTPGKGSLKKGVVLDVHGDRRITGREAGAAAADAYRLAREAVRVMTAAPGARIDEMARRRVVCHLAQQECGVLALVRGLAGRQGAQDEQAEAAEALQRCMDAAKADGCPSEQPPGGGRDGGNSGGNSDSGGGSGAAAAAETTEAADTDKDEL